MVDVLENWLENRTARVIVDGIFRPAAVLMNSLFPVTVLGLPLWNVYYEDAMRPLNSEGFTETVFADNRSRCQGIRGTLYEVMSHETWHQHPIER